MKKNLSYFKKEAKEAIQVSFLPKGAPDSPEVLKKRQGIVISVFFGVLIILILVWVLLLIRNSFLQVSISKAKDGTAKAEEAIKTNLQDFDYVRSLSARLAPAKQILEKHIFWTNFLKHLEENTLPDVTYGNIAVDEKNLVLSGTAKNYETAARQTLALRALPFIRNLKVSNLASRVSPKGEVLGVDFNLSANLDSSVFKF